MVQVATVQSLCETWQARIASSRAYEACVFFVGLLADFLELPRVLTSIFTWTIDLRYPNQSGSVKFCFAETQVGMDFNQPTNS